MTAPRRQLTARFLPVVVMLAFVVWLGAPEMLATAGGTTCSKRGKAAKAERASACRSSVRASWKRVKQRRRRSFRFGVSRSLFAPDSVWNLPVSRRSDIDPSSDRRIDALADFIDSQIGLPLALGGGYPNINADAYSTPIYRVAKGARRVSVDLRTGDTGATLRQVLAAGVPIPPYASPAAGTDGHMTVYQRSSDTLWEFWRARRTTRGWQASWGGAMRKVSRNRGYYDSTAWPGLKGKDGWNWGSTASSLPVAGGTVTLAELGSGRIDHALAMALPNACRKVFSWPAQRTDGRSGSANCIPQGAHLRLDPSLDLAALNLHPVAHALAKAAQTYGIIVRDRTRVSAAFFLESPPPDRPSPYTGPNGVYRGTPPWKVLRGFPWRRLQVLSLHLCTAAPCRRAR